MKIKKYDELQVWKDSINITKKIYALTTSGALSKDFGLRDQIRRAVVSISSNIVEGFEKNNNNEFIRFLKISKGSVGEVKNQFFICYQIGYFGELTYKNVESNLDCIAKQIGGLIQYLQRKREQKEFPLK